MKSLLALSLLILAGAVALAEVPVAQLQAMRSVSGQFNIYDRRNDASFQPPEKSDAPAPVLNLAPPFLVVSCERTKQALYDLLAAGRNWSGDIHVFLRPRRGSQDTAQISAERLGSRWYYRVEMPDRMPPDQFARTLVQVLLLELANRSATDRSAEIPLWLSEGLTQELLAARPEELILPPPTMSVGAMLVTPTQVQKNNPDSLSKARRVLQNQPAASLAELAWPEPEKFSPGQAEVFQCSAQLFVRELLRLPNGPDQLRQFLAALPGFYNWQTAFLHSYSEDFPNQLALEKWWALQSAFFVGRDHQQLWTLEESAEQLAAVLHASVAVRARAKELPIRTDVPLQVVIRDWDTPRQIATLQNKLNELAQVRRRVAPAFMMLVNDYAVVLDDYLTRRKRSTSTFGNFFSLSPSLKSVANAATQQLDALDARRAAIIATNAPPPPVAGDERLGLK